MPSSRKQGKLPSGPVAKVSALGEHAISDGVLETTTRTQFEKHCREADRHKLKHGTLQFNSTELWQQLLLLAGQPLAQSKDEHGPGQSNR